VTAAVTLLVFVAVLVFGIRRQWSRTMNVCQSHEEAKYTFWCDSQGCLRLVTFATDLLSIPAARSLAARLSPIHMFSLGTVLGAGTILRLGQLILPQSMLDLPTWALVWVAFLATVWLGVFVAERCFVTSRFAESSLGEEASREAFDGVLLAGVLYHLSTRHRLLLLTFAAMGLPAPWHVTLLFLLGIAAIYAYFSRGAARHILFTAIPSELERPFLPIKDQMRDGVWVAPAGLLLVLGAATLLFFNDVSSFTVAALCTIGCGLVVASERLSRIYSHHVSLAQFRQRLNHRGRGKSIFQLAEENPHSC
jgi:hypothetical protein